MPSNVTIPREEYGKRLLKAQRMLADTDLDVLLVHSNEADFANVRYFSNYWPAFETAGVLIPRQGDPTLLIGPESESYARDRSAIPRIRKMLEYRESADPAYPGVRVSNFSEVFREAGVGAPNRIGLGGYLSTTVPVIDALRTTFPDAELIRADQIMTNLRSLKTEPELACLREAFRIAECALDAVLRKIRPGMTELETVGVAQEAIYSGGAEYEGHPLYVLSGKNSSHAISRASHKPMEKGELIQLNIGARVDGYSSSVGRPVCLGKMSGTMKDLVDFGKFAHQETIGWLRGGAPASDVARKYRQLFVERDYERHFLYGPCHGLGMMEVEPPWMEEGLQYPLVENMTFQVDTFVQHENFGLRWENGVRISATGVEMFSSRNMEILELDC